MSVSGRLIRYFPKIRPNNPSTNFHIRFIHFHHRADQQFDEIPQRNISSLNSLLASYLRNNDAPASWDLFLHMHRLRNDLNSYTFTPVLGACSALPNPVRGVQVHVLMIKTGSDSETVTKTALMDMYSKHGQLGDSVRVFNEMGFKDVVTWNAMLSSFLRHGYLVKALGVFEEMRKERVEFSEFTLCSVLKACASLNAYRQGKQVHALVIVMGRDLVVLSTALIDFYSTVEFIDEAMKIYRNLSWRNDKIMQNSLISGCVLNKKYNEAFSIISKMKPNIVALTSALAACSENSDLWIGKQIHGVAIRRSFISDTQLCNTLLDMYAKSGKISNALLVFKGMPRKDVVSWTSMIDAYGSHGHGVEALELFRKMGEEGSGVLPNNVTLLSVLSACGHSGMVEQGRKCFVSAKCCGVEPSPEHYACLMDILGRAGRIEDVWCLFDDMVKNGTKPTGAVWAELLNACRINQDFKRGEIAAKNLLELEPDKPGNYVALSNFYAATGKWDSVDSLRRVMKERGMSKELGSSRIAVSRANEKLETSLSL
ncbi:hypothetical protein LguiB_033098 [Lonicera macranthoides]